MAMIIEFRGSAARSDARGSDARSQGEVVIFPGVRRERHAETAAAAPEPLQDAPTEAPATKSKRGKSKPKRDRIELAE